MKWCQSPDAIRAWNVQVLVAITPLWLLITSTVGSDYTAMTSRRLAQTSRLLNWQGSTLAGCQSTQWHPRSMTPAIMSFSVPTTERPRKGPTVLQLLTKHFLHLTLFAQEVRDKLETVEAGGSLCMLLKMVEDAVRENWPERKWCSCMEVGGGTTGVHCLSDSMQQGAWVWYTGAWWVRPFSNGFLPTTRNKNQAVTAINALHWATVHSECRGRIASAPPLHRS